MEGIGGVVLGEEHGRWTEAEGVFGAAQGEAEVVAVFGDGCVVEVVDEQGTAVGDVGLDGLEAVLEDGPIDGDKDAGIVGEGVGAGDAGEIDLEDGLGVDNSRDRERLDGIG
ncbi:MAG: hypothetical protein Q8S18_06035 [Bacteroidales bacterium]|nr:hypothetical protein [Bacteroidales bacterium]